MYYTHFKIHKSLYLSILYLLNPISISKTKYIFLFNFKDFFCGYFKDSNKIKKNNSISTAITKKGSTL